MIPVLKPKYGIEEELAVAEVLRSGWSGLGPRTKKFEDAFANFIGNGVYVVGTNSCTSALHLALVLLDIGEGDEVIIPALNFVAGAHAIRYVGATPVWTDIDPHTLCVSSDDIARKITKKTKAVMVMHYGGEPCDMDSIRRVTKHIPVVEDAAHACGAFYRGTRIGRNNITCFSFHAVKNLSMGEGGALVTRSQQLYERAIKLRWLGVDKSTCSRSVGGHYSWGYSIDSVGWKYHLSDVSAAIGLVQLEKLDENNSRRREIASLYRSRLWCVSGVSLIGHDVRNTSAQHLFVVKVDPTKRNDIINNLADRGIGTSVHYLPTYEHDVYRSSDHDCPNTDAVAGSILSLPMHLWLTDGDVDSISDALIEAVL